MNKTVDNSIRLLEVAGEMEFPLLGEHGPSFANFIRQYLPVNQRRGLRRVYVALAKKYGLNREVLFQDFVREAARLFDVSDSSVYQQTRSAADSTNSPTFKAYVRGIVLNGPLFFVKGRARNGGTIKLVTEN